MRIGQLAYAAGVPVDTVRYYERIGLLPPPPRTASGYREYAVEDLDRLRFINNSKSLGFTLEETGDLLKAISEASGSRGPVCDLAKARLREIDAQLERLTAMRDSLHRAVTGCSGQGAVQGCPVTEAVMAHSSASRADNRPDGAR